ADAHAGAYLQTSYNPRAFQSSLTQNSPGGDTKLPGRKIAQRASTRPGRKATMNNPEHRGDLVHALVNAAYAGRIDRRTFVRGLIAAGLTAAAARDMAEHAALAQANQAAQRANLKNEYDYVIVGAGSAGCVMAHRLSQDGRFSVLVIEGGGTNLDREKII